MDRCPLTHQIGDAFKCVEVTRSSNLVGGVLSTFYPSRAMAEASLRYRGFTAGAIAKMHFAECHSHGNENQSVKDAA